MFTSTRSARGAQARRRTFRIYFVIEGLTYAVIPLRPDPTVASRAYRFVKQGGDRAAYDVHVNGHGPECECLGYLRHRKCKHVRTLVAAGMVPAVTLPTTPGVTGGPSHGQEA